MAALPRCPSCSGFVPSSATTCPHCGAAGSVGSRIGFWLKAAGGGAVAVTMMACYGVPPGGPDLPEAPGPDDSKESIETKDAASPESKAEEPTPDEAKAEEPTPDAPEGSQ